MPTADRVLLMLDYENVQKTARTTFHQPGDPPQFGHIWPIALGELIVARRPRPSVLHEVRIYRGLPDPTRQPKPYTINQRQATVWSGDDRVKVHQRPLRYLPDWPTTPAQKKGVDVALAVDLVRLAAQGAYDVAVVFSRDRRWGRSRVADSHSTRDRVASPSSMSDSARSRPELWGPPPATGP